MLKYFQIKRYEIWDLLQNNPRLRRDMNKNRHKKNKSFYITFKKEKNRQNEIGHLIIF